ncbi:unnamed protein product [Prunus armeniaca]
MEFSESVSVSWISLSYSWSYYSATPNASHSGDAVVGEDGRKDWEDREKVGISKIEGGEQIRLILGF